ncbi:MAG: ATP-binding cassette domain-containing protein [Pseudomonadota bacterium]|nr:ATP-binding cassette domain-containing protein [Pseudomonadota bacterium]QKK04561.1 MAG: ATP-binding cassette domain-containing protein [Pseudomonadota bacterium]
MLYFDQVTLTYKENDSPVLDNISFRIARGEFRYLTGRNGAGKSSLMSLVAMATQPSRGQIRLIGQDVTRCARHQRQALRRKMGVLFQEPRLIDHISVFDNVALPLRLCHISEQNIHTSVIELLKWLDLDHKAYDLPTALSGGERQAVSLARGVVHRPLLILADEPTAHIDNESSKRILRLLSELNKLGTTVMMATHDRWILESWPRPALHLEGGKIMQIPSREVFAAPDSYDNLSSAA